MKGEGDAERSSSTLRAAQALVRKASSSKGMVRVVAGNRGDGAPVQKRWAVTVMAGLVGGLLLVSSAAAQEVKPPKPPDPPDACDLLAPTIVGAGVIVGNTKGVGTAVGAGGGGTAAVGVAGCAVGTESTRTSRASRDPSAPIIPLMRARAPISGRPAIVVCASIAIVVPPTTQASWSIRSTTAAS